MMIIPRRKNNYDLFDSMFEDPLFERHEAKVMKTDIKEHDDGYELVVDLPGFKKDQVQVELKDGYLTISAEKGLDKDEKEKENGRYIRKERYAGACSRSFYVGESVKQEDLKAAFNNGILTVAVPKEVQKPVEEKQYITIE